MVCDGKQALLQCNPGKRVKVTRAKWGRDDHVTCGNSTAPGLTSNQPTLDSDSDHVTEVVRKRCARKQNCEVEASKAEFSALSDPSVFKYLKVWHECIPNVSGVILPLQRSKRGVGVKQREFNVPRPEAAVDNETEYQVFDTGGLVSSDERNFAKNSSSEELGQSFILGKSNQQIGTRRNSSVVGKRKRNDEIENNQNLAKILEDLLVPSSFNE